MGASEQPSRSRSKAQAAREVDAALGVVRDGRHMPRVEGFNSDGARYAIRVAFHWCYFGVFPTDAECRGMRPSRLKPQDSIAVVQRVHQIAEREGWVSGAPLTCPGCGGRDVTLSLQTQPYRGCWTCGLFYGEMDEDTEDELRSRGYTKFDVARPEVLAS